jgi:hypothetical protein
MKKILLVITILLLAAAGYFAATNTQTSTEPIETTQNVRETSGLTLTIDKGDEQPVAYEVEYVQGQTAYGILEEVAEKENIELLSTKYDFGVFVKAINGLESSAEMAWIYFVNGQSGQVAADNHNLSDGDVVEWKFITPEE